MSKTQMTHTELYFDRMTRMALVDKDVIDDAQLFRQVRDVLREVERDARHRTVGWAEELVSSMRNMEPPR